MSFGVSIRNLNGLEILSSEYSSFEVIEEGILTDCAENITASSSAGTHIPIENEELLFVELDSIRVITAVNSTEAAFGVPANHLGVFCSLGDAYFGGFRADSASYTHGTRQIPYFKARASKNLTKIPSDYGLELYDSLGNLTYSSNSPSGVLRGIATIPESSINDNLYNKNFFFRIPLEQKPFEEKYYVCVNSLLPWGQYYLSYQSTARVIVNEHLRCFLEAGNSPSGYVATISAIGLYSIYENIPYSGTDTQHFSSSRTIVVVSK